MAIITPEQLDDAFCSYAAKHDILVTIVGELYASDAKFKKTFDMQYFPENANIPEPILTTIKDRFNGCDNDMELLMTGAKAGYNAAQPFIEEFKKVAQDVSDTQDARIKELQEENERLRSQIKA